MAWKVALPLGVGVFAASLAALVAIERHAPLEQKPSILLRLSTGALPSASLSAGYAAEAAKAEAAAADVLRLRVELSGLRAATSVVQNATRALDARIQEKQALE